MGKQENSLFDKIAAAARRNRPLTLTPLEAYDLYIAVTAAMMDVNMKENMLAAYINEYGRQLYDTLLEVDAEIVEENTDG